MDKDVNKLHEKWMKNPEYVKEWEASKEEFVIARTLIKARAEMADRMKTTQSVIARLKDDANG